MKKDVSIKEKINILILEDLQSDYELVLLQLKNSAFNYTPNRIITKDEFIKEIEKQPDIILADYNLPQFNALEALSILKEKELKIPFILVTGAQKEEVAVECMKQGADDYILKSNLTRLPAAVENVLYNKNLENEREHALSELAKSEYKFRSLYQSMPFPVIVYNPETFEILDVNEAATKMYGYTRDEFLQITLKEIRPPEEVEKLDLKKEMYSQDKASYLGEWKHMNKAGSVFDIEIYNYPVTLKGMKARVSIIHDISDRKLAIDALNRSERKYKSIFNEAPIGISNVDPEGKLLNANRAFEEMLGYSTGELKGSFVDSITHPEDLSASHFHLNKFISGNQASEKIEKRFIKKTGEIVWCNVTVSGVYDKGKKFLYTISMIEDITKRKKQENEIAESEKSYRGLFNSISDAIYILDEEGRFLDINDNAEKMYGYEKSEIIGQTPLMFNADGLNVTDGTFQRIRQVYEGSTSRIEWWGKRKNGEIFPHELSLSSGTYFGRKVVVAIARDITDRKKYETDLAESEKKYRDLADFLPQIVFEADLTGKLIYINKRGATALGYPLDYVYSGPSVISFLHPDDRDEALLNFRKNLEGEEGPGREYRLLKNDGTVLESIIYSSPLVREKNIEGIRGIVVDISAMKKMEEILRESERKYRLLFEKNLAAVFKSSVDGEIVEFNETFVKMYGYSSSTELLNNYTPDFSLKKELRDSVIPYLSDGKELNNIELKLKKKNGATLWVLGNIGLIQNENDKSFFVQGTLIDITDKKIAEEQANILARALTEISEFVVMTDENQRIIFVNDAFCKCYGYTFNEIIGRKSEVLDSDKNPAGLQKQIFEESKKGGWNGELINKTKYGREFPIYLSTKKMDDKSTGRVTYISISRDITRQKESESILKEAKERAEVMNNLKSTFLANMSHELRTPMIGILGYAGMIQEDTSDSEIKEMAGAIVKSANRLTETLNLILDLSKVEANKIDLRLHRVRISGIIDEVIDHHRLAANEKSINLIFSPEDDNIFAMLDERMISQVIRNLVNNAVKYTFKGKVEVQLGSENKSAVIKVSDTGIGIPGKNIDLIFEPFRQVSEGYNRKFEGTGLGLTISKKFVEMMKGSIEVTSEVNKGSVFTIKFPLLRGEKVSSKKTSDAESTGDTVKKRNQKANARNILLVEDDPVNANVINLFLRNYGSIDHSPTASGALEMINAKKYDVILMDINLKGMSGLDAVKLIRQHEEYREVPVVAVTAYAMAGDRKRFLDNGCTHYLPKPFTKKVIIDLLDSILIN